ncbi:MAG: hypothetical protein KJS92_05190, partial [Bacteroidetes bacterium]|nr:hypothetical protein [Bacteroidota bacterium]
GNEGKSLTDKRVLFWIPVLFGAIQICAAQQWALNRHKQLRGLISFVQKNCPSGKLAITGNPEQLDQRLQAAWALPYETLMSSRLFTPETTGVSVKLMRQEQPDSTYKKALFSGAVFTPPLPIVELNKRGYNLSPKPYCLLDAQQCNW